MPAPNDRKPTKPARRHHLQFEPLEDRLAPALLTAPTFGSTGVTPTRVLLADFNADGLNDILSVAVGNFTADLQLNLGKGTFPQAAGLPAGPPNETLHIAAPGNRNFRDVAVGEFNGDGLPDFAAVTYSGSNTEVFVFLNQNNNSNGAFLPFSAAQHAADVIFAADFNADGISDVVTATYGSDNVFTQLSESNNLGLPEVLPTGGASFGDMALADVTGDGKIDIVMTDANQATLLCYVNEGAGLFLEPPVVSPLGASPGPFVAADFTGDGKKDVAVGVFRADLTNDIAVLASDGLGAFVETTAVHFPSLVLNLQAADLTGDGVTDLIAETSVDPGTGEKYIAYAVHQGKSGGGFTQVETGVVATFTGPFGGVVAAVGPLNKGTTPDLAFAVLSHPGTFASLNGTDAPVLDHIDLAAGVNPATAGVAFNLTVTARNSDGSTATNYTGTVALSDGTASLGDVTFTAADNGVKTVSIVLAAAGNYLISAQDTANNAVFGSVEMTVNPPAASPRFQLIAETTTVVSGMPFYMSFNALRADGTPYTGYLGTPELTSSDPSFAPQTVLFGLTSNGEAQAVVALRGVGLQTVTLRDGNNTAIVGSLQFFVLPAPAPVDFRPLVASPISGEQDDQVPGATAIFSGQFGYFPFDSAKRVDDAVALRPGDNSVTLLSINVQDPCAPGSNNYPKNRPGGGISVGNRPTGAVAGNFDQAEGPNAQGIMPQRQDIAVANSESGSVSVVLDASIREKQDSVPRSVTEVPVGGTPNAVVAGRFNADDLLDLAVTNSATNEVQVLTNSAADPGQFGLVGSAAVGPNPTALVAAHFLGTALDDVAVINAGDDSVTILANTGGFTQVNHFGTGADPSSIVAADFDADGHVDLAVTSRGQGAVYVYYGDGRGGVSVPQVYDSGTGATSLVTGDFDGNGTTDLLAANSGATTLSLFLNGGARDFHEAQTYDTEIAPISLAVGDYNFDGRPDVMVLLAGGRLKQFNSRSG